MLMLERNPRKGFLFVKFPKLGKVSANSNIQQLARKYSEFHNFYIVNYGTEFPNSYAEPSQYIQDSLGEKKSVKENPNYSRY